MLIYVLNRKEELLTALHNDTELCGVLDFNITEDLVETNTLEFTVSGDVDGAEFLTKGNYVVTQNLAGVWKMFVIQTTRDSHGDVTTKSVYAEDYTIELGDLPLGVSVPTGEVDITTTIPLILAGTGVVADRVDTPFVKPTITENTSRSSKLSVINYLVGSCGMTVLTSVDVSQMPAKPIVKKVSIVEFNKSEGKRFEFDGNLVSIEREEDNTAIKTAIIPLGKALDQTEEDKEAGKPVEYITIKDVVWSTANGDPLDKPAGADILINPEATIVNGVKDSAGKFQPKVAVIHFNEIVDAEELALKAYWELEKLVKPRTSFTFTANDIVDAEDDGNNAVELGDKCYVIDNSVTPPIVEEVVVRRLSGNPDSKESMGIEIGTPQATLVDEDLSTQITNTIKNNGLISGNFTDLTAINAEIKNLKADKASITDLEAVKIKTETIEAEVGVINTLVSGNITSDNIHSSGITSDKLVISNGFIKDAMIETLSVDKIQAGTIDTGKISIASKDGGIVIEDNTQQFKDKNGKVRIQMGQDSKGEFSFGLFDESGTGTLIDSTGVKEGALGNDIIKEHMVSENAIGDKQIDYNKFTTGFNADTNTNTLKSSKVHLDGTNQTIDIAFNEMNTTVNNIQVGGRNLLQNTDFTADTNHWLFNGVPTFEKEVADLPRGMKCAGKFITNSVYSGVFQNIGAPAVGEIYTLSFYTKAPSNTELFVGYENVHTVRYTATPTWAKYSFTFTGSAIPAVFVFYSVEPSTFYLTGIKLEKGNKPTDWSPAIEDVQEQITANSTEIKVQQGKIETAIKNTTIVKDGKESLLKDEHSKLEQTVSGLSLTVGSHTTEITNTSDMVDKVKEVAEQGLQVAEGAKVTADQAVSDAVGIKEQADKGVADAFIAKEQALLAEKLAQESQATADKAKESATEVYNNFQDLGRDDRITPVEKLTILKDWQSVQTEFPLVRDEGISFGLSVDKLIDEYGVLSRNVEPYLKDMDKTEELSGAHLRDTFMVYYAEKQKLLTAISLKNKQLSDTAQAIADKGVADALLAQHEAEQAVRDAERARQQAIQALIDAKNFTNAEITTVNKAIQTTNSAIDVLKDKIELKVEQTDINNSITNVVIGGSNLYTNSGADYLSLTETNAKFIETIDGKKTLTYTEVSSGMCFLHGGSWLTVGEEYTFSFYAKATVNTVLGSLYINDTNRGYLPNAPVTTSWKKYTVTFVTQNPSVRVHVYPVIPAEQKFYLTEFKLEKGNKATDWSPAPADVDKAIADTITITEDKIKQAKAEIKVETDSIKQSVSSVDTKVTTVTTNTDTAMRQGLINTNPNFANWTGQFPDGYQHWMGTCHKETTLTRNGAYAYRGIAYTPEENVGIDGLYSFIPNVANVKYLYVEIDFMLVSGVTHGAGLLLDWQGMDPYRSLVRISEHTDNPTLGKWYTVRTVVQRPTDNVANWSSMRCYVMTNYAELGNGAKDIVFDRVAIREATTQEIATHSELPVLSNTANHALNVANSAQGTANGAVNNAVLSAELAKALSTGKMMYTDPTFKGGVNGTYVYNNHGGPNATWTRVPKPADCPTTSEYCMEAKAIGECAPNFGGFFFGTATRANAILITKIVAKIPEGRYLEWGSNQIGDGGSSKWLTPNAGTGRYEEYVFKVVCGPQGTHSTTNFFSVSGGPVPTPALPLVWHVAYATVFDVTDNDERVNEHAQQITTVTERTASLEVNIDGIAGKVSSLEQTTKSTAKVGAFRYVRDWLAGSTANGGNHWVELEVWAGGANVARGIIPTSTVQLVTPHLLTDGNTASYPFLYDDYNGTWNYVQLDLGAVLHHVDMIRTFHYWEDGRQYNHKLQVSMDGINWVDLYNSDVSGRYVETGKGRAYVLNESYTESRLNTAEQKITPTAITNSVSENINNGGSINTVSTVLDKDGLTVNNGALTVKNKKGEVALRGDVEGNLQLQKSLTVGGANIGGNIAVKSKTNTEMVNINSAGVAIKTGGLVITSDVIAGDIYAGMEPYDTYATSQLFHNKMLMKWGDIKDNYEISYGTRGMTGKGHEYGLGAWNFFVGADYNTGNRLTLREDELMYIICPRVDMSGGLNISGTLRDNRLNSGDNKVIDCNQSGVTVGNYRSALRLESSAGPVFSVGGYDYKLQANNPGGHCLDLPNNNWNNAIENGFYMGHSSANAPSPEWWMGTVISHNGLFVYQKVTNFANSRVWYDRYMYGGSWGSWNHCTSFMEVQSTMDAENLKLKETMATMLEEKDNEILQLKMALAEVVEEVLNK